MTAQATLRAAALLFATADNDGGANWDNRGHGPGSLIVPHVSKPSIHYEVGVLTKARRDPSDFFGERMLFEEFYTISVHGKDFRPSLRHCLRPISRSPPL